MSVTFEAMLLPAFNETKAIVELNRALHVKDVERHQQFNQIDMGAAGGTKFFTSAVYAACFNHLIPGTVEECICRAPWRSPDHVLYVRDLGDYAEDEFSFTAVSVADMRALSRSQSPPALDDQGEVG